MPEGEGAARGREQKKENHEKKGTFERHTHAQTSRKRKGIAKARE